MVPGQPSALEIMRQEGLVDEGFALRLTEIMNTGVQTQKAVAKTGEAADLRQVVPTTERLVTKTIRFLGLRIGRGTTERVPGSGQGLSEPVMIELPKWNKSGSQCSIERKPDADLVTVNGKGDGGGDGGGSGGGEGGNAGGVGGGRGGGGAGEGIWW